MHFDFFALQEVLQQRGHAFAGVRFGPNEGDLHVRLPGVHEARARVKGVDLGRGFSRVFEKILFDLWMSFHSFRNFDFLRVGEVLKEADAYR